VAIVEPGTGAMGVDVINGTGLETGSLEAGDQGRSTGPLVWGRGGDMVGIGP
jgi:hypothetical protein